MKTRPGRKGKPPPIESLHKLIAYQISQDDSAPIRPVTSRDRFLSGLEKGKPQVVAQGWQKDYMQNAKNKKPIAHPFTNLAWWTDLERTEDNHDTEKI